MFFFGRRNRHHDDEPEEVGPPKTPQVWPEIDFRVPAGATTLDRATLVDKIRGAIIGNGIGDAIGVCTEFSTKAAVIEEYGPNHDFTFENMHCYRFPRGDWTDDSDQMIEILDMMIENKHISPLEFAERLDFWISHGFPELGDTCGMGLGGTVASSVFQSCFFTDPWRAAEHTWLERNKNAAANGAVMRTSVLGVPQFHDLGAVTQHAEDIAKVTHVDTRCVASCVACCAAIALMLQGRPTNTPAETAALLAEAQRMAEAKLDPAYTDDFRRYLNAGRVEDLQLDESRAIGYTFKCIGSGFYGVRSGKDFRTVINEVTQEAGDADTNGAVAGAMLGCKVGYSHLPQDWVRGLKWHDWLMVKIDRLLVMMGLLDPPAVPPHPACPYPQNTFASYKHRTAKTAKQPGATAVAVAAAAPGTGVGGEGLLPTPTTSAMDGTVGENGEQAP